MGENDEVDRVDNGQYGFAGGNRFRDNYIDHWGRDSHNRRKIETKKRRKPNRFILNYLKNWDRAPLIIMDDKVNENEEYAMKEYIQHYVSPLKQKPFQYNLNKNAYVP